MQVALCRALRVAYDLGHNHGNPAINTTTPSPRILRKIRVLESALSLRQLCNPFLGTMSSRFLSGYSRNLQFCSLTFIAKSIKGPGSDLRSAVSVEVAFRGMCIRLAVNICGVSLRFLCIFFHRCFPPDIC